MAVGGLLAVTPVTLRRVRGPWAPAPPGSGPQPDRAARLVPGPGPRAAAVRDAGAVLAPAAFPDPFSQPLSPLSAAPAARGCFVPPSPWECSLFDGGFGFQLGVEGDIDLWDFPAVPFSQQVCSSREAEVGVQPPQPGYFNQGHGSLLAFPATRGFCRLPGGCPRPGPLSQAASGCPHRLLCCGNVVLEQQGARMQTLQGLQQESWRLPRRISKCKFSSGVQAWHRTEISSVYTSLGCCRPNPRVLFAVVLTKY